MNKRSNNSGLSLTELLIALAVLSMVMGSIVTASITSQGAYSQGISTTDLETRVNRAIERIVRDLSSANSAALNPPAADGDDNLEFQRPVDSIDGAIVWGPVTRYAFELMPGELDNNLDDNGNGLVDEGSLVRIEDPGGPNQSRLVVANRVSEFLEGEDPNGLDDNGNGLVDEKGLAFSLEVGDETNALLVRLSLQGVGSNGATFSRTAQTRVALRN